MQPQRYGHAGIAAERGGSGDCRRLVQLGICNRPLLQHRLIAVVRGLEGAVLRHVDVGSLLVGEDGKLGAQLGKVQRRHLLIQVLRQHVHLLLVAAGLALVPQLQLGDNLVGEGAGHDEGGVPGGTSQVQQPPLCQHDHTVAVREDEPVHLRLDILALDARPRDDTSHVNLIVEVTDVAHDGVVLHLRHVLRHDDVLVAGGGDEDVHLVDDVTHGSHLVALHGSLQRADGVNLADNGAGARCLHSGGRSLAHVTVACHEHHLASNHDIGGTHDAVGQRVAAAVHIVKLGLGDGVVDVDGREQERVAGLHLIEALDTGGGLLGDTLHLLGHGSPPVGVLRQALLDDGEHNLELGVVGAGGVRQGLVLGIRCLRLHTLVDQEGGVATIVHQQVGTTAIGPGQHLLSAPPVLLQSLALPGEHCSRVARDGGCGVVLGGEDVAGAPSHFGAQSSEGLDEHCCLHSHVQGASDLCALEGLAGAELSAAGHQSGHLGLGQVDLQAPEVSLGDVLHLVLEALLGLGDVQAGDHRCGRHGG
mmetsp:Transcript_10109/g.30251  ORF Transcript_10109/g.30251 Transcript_10109/m.30251 type:complete len:533 (+) Transcript_10109:448-2046(+)